MANTAKSLFRGSASTGSTTLYTVPAATTTVVTEIVACNTASTSATVTVLLDEVEILDAATVAADTTLVVPLKQPLATTKIIAGFASATTVKLHIAGMEIT